MRPLLILALALVVFMIGSPVYAYTPPTQGTDNVTDTIIWHGDTANISITSGSLAITSGTITITDLEDSITASAEAGAQVLADEIETLWGNLLPALLMLSITWLAYWRDRSFLYILVCPLNLVYGLILAGNSTLFDGAWVGGVIIAIVGLHAFGVVIEREVLPMLKRVMGG